MSVTNVCLNPYSVCGSKRRQWRRCNLCLRRSSLCERCRQCEDKPPWYLQLLCLHQRLASHCLGTEDSISFWYISTGIIKWFFYCREHYLICLPFSIVSFILPVRPSKGRQQQRRQFLLRFWKNIYLTRSTTFTLSTPE